MTGPLARAEVEVHADTSGFDGELKRNIDKSVKNVDRSTKKAFDRIGKSADDLGQSIGDRLGNGIKKLGSALSTVSQASGIIGSFSSMLAIISSLIPAVLALGGALSALSGALILLPGALATVAAAGLVVKLGMQGMGDAFKAIASGDSKKLDEALKKLAPSARAFVKEISRVAPEFGKVQKAIQGRLFLGLAKEIEPIAKNILPAFRTGTLAVADVLNKGAKSLAGFLKEGETAGVLDILFRNVVLSLQGLGPALRPGLEALQSFIQVGSNALPDLAKRLGSALAGFSQGISDAAASGELEGRLRQALDLIGQLGSIAANVAGTIGNIFFAANDGGQGEALLGRIERLTAALRELSGSDEGQQKIRDFLGFLGTVAPIAAGVALLANSISLLSGALAFLLTPVGAIVGVVAALGLAFALAYKYIAPFRQAVDQLVAVAGPALAAAFQNAVNLVRTQLVPALQGAANAALPLVRSLGPVLRDTILPAIQSVINAYQAQFKPALDTIVSTINGTVTPAIQRLTAAYLANKPQIDQVISAVVRAVAAFGRFQAFIGGAVFQTLIRLGGVVLAGVINQISAVISYVGSAVRAFNSVSAAASRFGSAVSAAVTSAVGFLRGLPGRARSAIGDLGSTLYQSGRSLVSGFARGIADAAAEAVAAARRVVGSVRDFFPGSPAKVGPLSGRGWVLYGGEAMSEAFAQGITQSASAVTAAARQVASISAGMFGTGPLPSTVSGASSSSTTGTTPTPVRAGNTSTNIVNVYPATGNAEATAMTILNRLAAATVG